MLNYMKSEFYRIFHSKEIYVLTGIFTILLATYNLGIYFCQALPNFQYANTWHTYGMVDTSMGVLIFIVIIICSTIDNTNLRNMKNTVAYGIDRKIVFLGRIITQSAVCLAMYLGLMGFHFGMGKLLLEDSGREASEMFIRSTFVCIPMFLGVVVIYHCCILWNKNAITAVSIMIVILMVVPKGMSLLAYKLPQFKKISDMLMYNLMQVQFVAKDTGGYLRVFTWDTTAGVIKCMIAGISAIVIFSIIGVRVLQKKEIR